MDLHEQQLVEYLALDAALTPEEAAHILIGAAGYASDALHALDECTRPELDQRALHELAQRAAAIEGELRALHRVAVERCCDEAVRDIPTAVAANLELVAKCRAVIARRRLAVEQEVMILRAPLPTYQLPC